MIIFWACWRCDQEMEVDVSPPQRESKRGHPDTWFPGEDASIDPKYCTRCGEEIDISSVLDSIED